MKYEDLSFNITNKDGIEVEGDYILKVVTDPTTIKKIKELSEDEIVQYVNKEVQDNIE